MIFQIFTPGNFPDTNLASDPVTRVPENIKRKSRCQRLNPFHKGVCLICGTVLIDCPLPQRRPWNVSFLSADRAPEPTGLSADINQLVTISLQLAPTVRTVETVALSNCHIHNSHLNHAPYSAARRIAGTRCSRPHGSREWHTAFSKHCRTDPL